MAEKDVPIYCGVGRHAGRVHQRPDPRPRQRAPRQPELQGGLAREDRRPPVPGRCPAVPDRRSTRPPPSSAWRSRSVAQAEAQVSASQAQVEQAKRCRGAGGGRRHGRRRPPSSRRSSTSAATHRSPQRGSVSQQELDNAVQTNLANLAAVAAARAALAERARPAWRGRRRRSRRRGPTWRRQQADVAAARAALADAQLNLGYTRVHLAHRRDRRVPRAPTSGTSSARTTPRPLTTVSQVDPIYARVRRSASSWPTAVFRRWADDPAARRQLELELILADGSVYPRRGRARHPGPAGRRDDRHRDGARHLPESRQRAAPRPVRQGPGGRPR